MIELSLRNRQRRQFVNLTLLREITESVLGHFPRLKSCELGITFVSPREMARINQDFLQHTGSTDVITFDHADAFDPAGLHGELFISVADAIEQAREFHTTWPEELTRYVIHGILHLRGFDDLTPAKRRVMKREESRLLRATARRFSLSRLGRKPKVAR